MHTMMSPHLQKWDCHYPYFLQLLPSALISLKLAPPDWQRMFLIYHHQSNLIWLVIFAIFLSQQFHFHRMTMKKDFVLKISLRATNEREWEAFDKNGERKRLFQASWGNKKSLDFCDLYQEEEQQKDLILHLMKQNDINKVQVWEAWWQLHPLNPPSLSLVLMAPDLSPPATTKKGMYKSTTQWINEWAWVLFHLHSRSSVLWEG